ncbi:MAG: hypothetical protein JW956_15050 [Calditrichaceae bacterium]|nr:hypothetical protein [Calditrichaceae bacterium]
MNLYETYLKTSFSEIDFWPVLDIFDDFILGRNIKRTMHHLRYDGYLMSKPFIDRLRMYKYQPMLLNSIQVKMGKRIPAFYLLEDYVIFGYVFSTTDSKDNVHAIFGSAEKDEKGQSKYLVRGNRDTIVFINPNQQEDILN